jgi:hypothetical protein
MRSTCVEDYTVMNRIRRLGSCFVLGAVVGTLLDGIHVYGDVLSYPHPAFGRWAWFVPLEFGLLGVIAGVATPVLERLAGQPRPSWTVTRRALELCLFAGLYLATAVVPAEAAVALAVALLALAAVRIKFWSVPGDSLYVVLAAIAGPAVEAALSAAGAFEYHHPDIAGIPWWLPGLWANGGLLIRRAVLPIVDPSARSAKAP